MTKTINKSAAARAAKAAGLKTFTAHCKRHGETTYNSSGAQCVACKAAQYAQTVATPEARETLNEYWRARFVTNSNRRGQIRENTAAKDWRKRTGGSMAGWYGLDRELIQRLYGECREGFEVDHATPKVAYGLIDGKREIVATGLHCYANLVETPKAVNREKRTQFAPDTNRLQRPANRGPGGAYDPAPTVRELELVELAKQHGTPARVSLNALRDSLDSQAHVYEAHVDAVESDLCVRYTNALALMLGYAGMMVSNAVTLEAA
ncbi:hypothetical protein PQR46_20370 [Paraburkholderia sediminicola]|uniref:hypothetical protein n=1 Tax=Paraburkholderia sediminicola TaxID=458836 RepID=UPI0038BC1D1D